MLEQIFEFGSGRFSQLNKTLPLFKTQTCKFWYHSRKPWSSQVGSITVYSEGRLVLTSRSLLTSSKEYMANIGISKYRNDIPVPCPRQSALSITHSTVSYTYHIMHISHEILVQTLSFMDLMKNATLFQATLGIRVPGIITHLRFQVRWD